MSLLWTLPTKETAACCVARRDALGRPPIGFCSPDCERRRVRDLLIEWHSRIGPMMRGRRMRLDGIPGYTGGYEPWQDEFDDPTGGAALVAVP